MTRIDLDNGRIVLYCGDNAALLDKIPRDAAIVTDPPYGIGEDGGLKARYRIGDGRTRGVIKHEFKGWDSRRPDKQVFDEMLEFGRTVFICGGNYFADMLPASQGWLYWDKRIGGDFSDGELIYTNRHAALRSFSMHPFEGLNGGKDRVHPTQKPVALMEWCIGFTKAETIADPYAGSFTTAIAAIRQGRKFWGCEIDEKYFADGVARIKDELAKRDSTVGMFKTTTLLETAP